MIRRPFFCVALLGVLVAACGAPANTQQRSVEQRPTAPTRAVAVIRGDIPTLMPGTRGAVPGAPELEELLTVGLTSGQGRGEPFIARAAEAVPSVDNGLWRLLPDGRMETTWRLRRDGHWHDGVPMTADDFTFKARLEQDERMPFVDPATWDARAKRQLVDEHGNVREQQERVDEDEIAGWVTIPDWYHKSFEFLSSEF